MSAYVSIEQAQEYFESRLHAGAWAEAAEPEKEKALIMAAKAIDRQPLRGRKMDPSQALAFPRYPDTEVPEAVKEACCEEALALLGGNSQRRKLQQEGVISVTVGSVSETYATAGAAGGLGLRSLEAKELLRPWLLGAVGIT